MEQKLERFASKQTVAIATDIETYKEPYPTIRCVGYTAIYFDSSSNIFSSESLVIPCDSIYNLAWIRRFNAIEIPKIFQNGKYDISYLQAYNSAPWGYLWDTAEMMHSWYAELPKDLASLNSFFVRDSMYWKDLAQTNDLETYYLYNARDTWATANVFIAWIAEAPTWAKANYLNTFPLQYPCHLSEMTGIARDDIAMLEACREQEQVVAQQGAALGKMLATPNFNTNSPIQMKALLKILGCGDLPNADSKALAKAALRHPLNARIIGAIIASRKAKKLISTYLTKGKEFHGWNLAAPRPTSRRGRILYSLNPHGTDTGRLASKEHHFWCGLQIQNIPRGILVKRTLVADAEFLIAECDLRQAESRDTAFISGDNNLITAVTGDKDFHSLNASAFFGLSYDSIFETSSGKVLNKPIRQIAKNVNHGANYLMGAMVLIDTMGEDKVWQAGRLLNLPKLFSLKQIAEYLLAAFHRTYPGLAKHFYPGVIAEVITTHMLSSKAFHDAPTYSQAAPSSPLVRYCFGNPSKSKSDLNALVAHVPQSLNAMTLNRAYMRVFYEIAVNPSYSNHFKLLCQIHDSILFQFRIGHEYLIQMVADCMEIPVTVTAYDGITRTFTVPADIKAGSGGVGASRWSETE
jgi:DNA polymerase I-like protein with 3'-5' exonuclease and polymerase domains